MQKSKCKMINEQKNHFQFCILHFAFIIFFSSLIAAALIPAFSGCGFCSLSVTIHSLREGLRPELSEAAHAVW